MKHKNQIIVPIVISIPDIKKLINESIKQEIANTRKKEIIKVFNSGMSYRQIAGIVGLSHEQVRSIVNNKVKKYL